MLLGLTPTARWQFWACSTIVVWPELTAGENAPEAIATAPIIRYPSSSCLIWLWQNNYPTKYNRYTLHPVRQRQILTGRDTRQSPRLRCTIRHQDIPDGKRLLLKLTVRDNLEMGNNGSRRWSGEGQNMFCC